MQLLLPRRAVELIKAGGSEGQLIGRLSHSQNVGAVVAVTDSAGTTLPCEMQPSTHFLASCEKVPTGRWVRATEPLWFLWFGARARHAQVPREVLAERLGRTVPPGHTYLLVSYCAADEAEGRPPVLGWHIHRDSASPIDLVVEPNERGTAALEPGWPSAAARALHVLLVGVGSIGSAAAHALADYGVGRLTLLDPDRLRWHNLVRHRSGPRHVGAEKVMALRDELSLVRPDTTVHPLPLDVTVDADLVRPLLTDVDVMVCCADGVTPRRVVSHLARRAATTAVMGCVLEDGGLGEVLRQRPWAQHGCLTCRRRDLTDRGAFDPEPALDAPYGTGSQHRPMTAVGGDLALLGHLVATTAVFSGLEQGGYAEYRLPGEHAVLMLRPRRVMPHPFDAPRALDLRWYGATPARPGCPTCEPSEPAEGLR